MNTLSYTLLLFTGSIFMLSCSGEKTEGTQKDAAVPVITEKAGTDVVKNILASGRIESQQSAVISTRIMGFVTGIKVEIGEPVKKGDLLATISNNDIVAKKAQAQALVTEAEAALKDAQKDYERFSDLYKQQSASEKEYENATLHYHSVKAKAEAARQMRKEAEAMLTYTNLRAPFSGVVTQKHIDVGSMANPGMPLLVVEKIGAYEVSASVAENDIPYIKEGANASVLIKSAGRTINGKVREISPSSQYSGGQYMITVSISEDEQKDLYPGMYAHVTITSSDKSGASDNIVLVPQSAIIHNDQLTGLYTISENQTALFRWVKLGKTYGDQVEILSGLSAEEEFILVSDSRLYNGVPVTVKVGTQLGSRQ